MSVSIVTKSVRAEIFKGVFLKQRNCPTIPTAPGEKLLTLCSVRKWKSILHQLKFHASMHMLYIYYVSTLNKTDYKKRMSSCLISKLLPLFPFSLTESKVLQIQPHFRISLTASNSQNAIRINFKNRINFSSQSKSI